MTEVLFTVRRLSGRGGLDGADFFSSSRFGAGALATLPPPVVEAVPISYGATQAGRLFSRNERMPSRPSGEARTVAMLFAVRLRMSSLNSPRDTSRINCLVAASAAGPPCTR